MDHKEKLAELNRASLEKFEEYMKSKADVNKEHHEKVHTAKEEWQYAYNKLMETLLVLERLEI